MTDSIERIKIKLYQLRELDNDFEISGANDHRYLLNPCLTIEQVEEFELKNDVKLPDEYVRFITEVGNGGAGPFHGLLSLEASHINFFDSSEKKDHTYFDLSNPFPHVTAWNVENELQTLYGKNRRGKFSRRYWFGRKTV